MKRDKKLIDAYWEKNFNDKKVVGQSNDLQINIARTKEGKPISKEDWHTTLGYIAGSLDITKQSRVLELCCGNGVIIGNISDQCKEAIGVDYSEELLNQLQNSFKNKNLSVVSSNVLDFKIKESAFDAIILYFSLQHFNERDSYLLIEKCIKGLKPKGKILIGDIPDLDKKWHYVNQPNYHIDYFNRVLNNTPKIGYWYQKDFFMAMNSCFPNVSFKILEQPKYQINAGHCFDVLIQKK